MSSCYQILRNPFFLSLSTISSECCHFLSVQLSSLLSKLYQLISLSELMDGKLVLTHTLHPCGTRGQESGDLGRGDPEEGVDGKIRYVCLFMFQRCEWRGLI